MKKITLALTLATLIGAAFNASAETRTASATASWDTKVTKDTKSALTVVPMKSLIFNYAEANEDFNLQDGAFSITIAGQSGATDFSLTSKIISNTLTRNSDKSALKVGINWNGNDLSTETPVTLIDTAKGISSGLDALVADQAYAGKNRVSSMGNFGFTIKSATVDGTEKDFKELNDGYWAGDVKVEFTATWTGDFVTA